MHSTPKPRSDGGFAFPASEDAGNFAESAPNIRETWLLGITLGILYVIAIALSFHGAERTDELYHYAQIYLFRHGEWRVLDHYLTTIPGYHASVALLLKITGLDSLGAARAITSLFGLAAIAVLHRGAHNFNMERSRSQRCNS